ncbi:hypothetical protein XELAEV_18027386mg [Xenopus laevis]|uniref:Thrombospondin-like N-terminal domain-containing protein n=1 Tax=Xenopus laevis TaxID=8355 RepID=A0A974CVC9_XENLA|nr:hypothetical protein XELAEV_18027386mg [Xenopus laevis]
MDYIILWMLYFGMKILFPVTSSMALSNRTVCPILRTDGVDSKQIYKQVVDMSGYDLAERFSLRQISCGSEHTCFKLGSTPLIKDTMQLFPNGLPDEYSFVATFRVRRTTKKERWFLWQTMSRFGNPQDSILIDGNKKVVEFTTKHNGVITLQYTFKSRELHLLFDRQWHKLGLSIESKIISLYIDCKLIERRQTDRKDGIDMQGSSVITTRASDGKPADIELQRITIYCSPKRAAQQNCCEISDGMCPSQESLQTTASAIVAQKINSLQSKEVIAKDKCPCLPHKGEKGSKGEIGIPGQIGDKGEEGTSGLAGLQVSVTQLENEVKMEAKERKEKWVKKEIKENLDPLAYLGKMAWMANQAFTVQLAPREKRY